MSSVPVLRLMVNLSGKSFLVVVNYDATIKDAKAEIGRVFSSIWCSALDSTPCSVEQLCFGGYVLCDDYCVGVLLHDMAKVTAYREGESQQIEQQDSSMLFPYSTPQLPTQAMSTPYVPRTSISGGVYTPINAHQSPHLQSPNISSSLTPEQYHSSNSMKVLGNGMALFSRSTSGSLCNSVTSNSTFVEASKSGPTGTAVDNCGGPSALCASPALSYDSHNDNVSNHSLDVSITPHINEQETPLPSFENISCSKTNLDPEQSSSDKPKKASKKRKTTEEMSSEHPKVVTKKTRTKRKVNSQLLTCTSDDGIRQPQAEVVNESTTQVPGKHLHNQTSTDSEADDVLAEETASTDSESLLSHSHQLNTSLSSVKDCKAGVVKKAKKVKMNTIEGGSATAAEEKDKKQAVASIESTQDDHSVAIIATESVGAPPHAPDGPVETSTIDQSVPNSSVDDTIDLDVVLVKDTQDASGGEGEDTDCRPLTPEIPLQGNVPVSESAVRETDETGVPDQTEKDGFNLLLSDTESVVALNKLHVPVPDDSLTDTSEMSVATSNRSIVQKKKHKRKSKKAKGAVKETKISVNDSESTVPIAAPSVSSVSLDSGASTSKLSRKTKEKKSERKRKGCGAVESEMNTPVSSKRMKLQNKEENSEPLAIVDQSGNARPVASTETSESTVAAPSLLFANETEAPLPKKRRRKKNKKYDDNCFMELDSETHNSPRKKSRVDKITGTDLDDVQSTSIHETQDMDESGTHPSPIKKKASDETVDTHLSIGQGKVVSSQQIPLDVHEQLGKSAALNKLMSDAKHVNTVKYLRSLFDVLLTANSSSTPKSSDNQITKVDRSEVKQSSKHMHVTASPESTASNKIASNDSSPAKSVKPPPKSSHASLSLSAKGSLRTKDVKKVKTHAPSIPAPILETLLSKNLKEKTLDVVGSGGQTETKKEPPQSIKKAQSKEPKIIGSVKHVPQQTLPTMKNNDDSESETSSDTSLSTSESDDEQPNQLSARKRTSLVSLLDEDTNSKKKGGRKLTASLAGSASQLARAQQSFSSVFSSPLPAKKQQSTSPKSRVDKGGVKALGTKARPKKKMSIKSMSLSQQEEELCNSQNLSQLLDNEQLWASDHSDS